MNDILILLPPVPFENEDFKNALNAIEKELKSNKLHLYCNEDSKEYYKINYGHYKIDTLIYCQDKYISKEIISREYNSAYNTKQYIFIILKNINHSQAIEVEKNSDINIYRYQILNNRVCSIKDEITEAEDIEIDSNVFSIIHKKQKGLFGLVPYGFTVRHPGYGYVNEMGFRIPKEYQTLKYRDSNHKLICFFGGSCCYSMRVRDDEIFTKVLEDKLNNHSEMNNLNTKYTVLNFGMIGYVLINELITYMMYAEELNPDFVVGYHLLNDLQCGMANDNLLLKKFNLSYNHRYEQWANILHKSDVQLKWDENISMHNQLNTPKDIINAYYTRELQFEKIATNNNSKYISIIQPMYFSKSKLSKREKVGYDFYTAKGVNSEYIFIKNMYEKYISFMKQKNRYKDILDLHTEFKSYDENDTLFCDSAHTLTKGDEVIASHIFNFLENKGLL